MLGCVMRRHDAVMMLGRDTVDIAADIAAWQDAQTDLISIGGLPEAIWGGVGSSGWTLNSTYLNCGQAIKQDCAIQQIKLQQGGGSASGNWKVKVWRLVSGTTFTLVAEQGFTLAATSFNATRTITLSPSINVQVGDVVSLFVPAGNTIANSTNTLLTNLRWAGTSAGDITANTNFTTTNAKQINIEAFSNPPYLVVVGDSIAEGHNGATNWHGSLHNIALTVLPGGEPTSEIANQLRGLLGNGSVLKYQNLGLGSQTFAYLASTSIPAAHALKPSTIIVHCGTNDVLTGRTWANVEANLDTIKATITTERLLVDEILPCTNATDLQAADIRAFNTNFSTWCTANDATLIPCWSVFGQARVSTGENDDLLAAYSQGGTHLSAAGVNALATIWRQNL